MQTIKIKPRIEFGTISAKRLRRNGQVPIVVTSHGKTENYQISAKDLQNLLAHGVRESTLLNFVVVRDKESSVAPVAPVASVAPESFEVFIKESQIDRLNDKILHMDFFKITRGEKIVTRVPIKLEGTPIGIKSGGILEVFMEELEVQCFPRHLPEEIPLNIQELGVHDSIRVKDIAKIENVEMLLNPETLILSISISKIKEEVVKEEEVEEKAETEETKSE